MSENTHAGGCLCGAIRFQAHGKPLWVDYCHCHSCRRNTGAPVTSFVGFRPGVVQFQGERTFYPSSPGVRRGFCSRCGTPMTYETDDLPDEIHFYISVMDAPEDFVPTQHVFHDEAIDWFEVHDGLPRYEGTNRETPDSWGPKAR